MVALTCDPVSSVIGVQLLCQVWQAASKRNYHVSQFDKLLRELAPQMPYKNLDSVLHEPDIKSLVEFCKLNHLNYVTPDEFRGEHPVGTILIVPPLKGGELACHHAVTRCDTANWYPEEVDDDHLASYFKAFCTVFPAMTESELETMKTLLHAHRVLTPYPYKYVIPSDSLVIAPHVPVGIATLTKNGIPVAYDIFYAPSTTTDRFLAFADGKWYPVRTPKPKAWKKGEVFKPIFENQPSNRGVVAQAIRDAHREAPRSDVADAGTENQSVAPEEPQTTDRESKAYALSQTLFRNQSNPGRAWLVSTGKVVNIDMQLALGKCGKEIMRSIYPKEYSWADSQKFAGFFEEHYGHPTLRYLVNSLVVRAFAKCYTSQQLPVARVADCGSKYHQLAHMVKPEEFDIEAYRPEIAPFDKVYNATKIQDLPVNWHLNKNKWQGGMDLGDRDLMCVDAIYYPGVKTAITEHLHRYPKRSAYVVFTAYAQHPGRYSYIDNEGAYSVYRKPKEHASLFEDPFELWVRNMPSENNWYEHPLFDYTPYRTRSTLDVNGIYWSEQASYAIGNEARIVYCILTASHPVQQIVDSIHIDHEEDDDLDNRYLEQEELKGLAMAYFEFKKLKVITEEDRLAAACYVHSKTQTFVVSQYQRAMTMRNVLYAAVDYLAQNQATNGLRKEYVSTFSDRVQRTLTRAWMSLQARVPEEVNHVQLTIFFIFAVWNMLFFVLARGGAEYLIALCFWGQDLGFLMTIYHHARPIILPLVNVGLFILWIMGASLLIHAHRIVLGMTRAIRDNQAARQYETLAGKVLGLQIKDTINFVDLTRKQRAELEMPFNECLKIKSTLTKVLKLARDVVTSEQIPAFFSSGYQFTCEFVRTTPSVMKKNIVNTLHALFVRQCGHQHNFKPSHLKMFTKFAQRVMDEEIIPIILQNPAEYTMEEHLRGYKAKKRALYTQAWEQFMTDFNVKHTAECMQKSNELQFGDTVKPRFLFNPSGSVKVIGTYINAYYLKRLQSRPWLAVGLNTGQLCDRIQQEYARIPDPVPVTWDGSNHDGHQYKEIIKAVDGYLFRKTFAHVLPHLVSLPPGLMNQYQKILESVSTNFYISQKRGNSYVRVVEGSIQGTTFSGHPTRTTLGNSLRVYLYARFVAYRARVQTSILVAGDDVLCFVPRQGLAQYRQKFWKSYIDGSVVDTKDSVTHGLGQVAKDYRESTDGTIDFLSKYGMIYNDTVLLNRRIERALLSGNHSRKISKLFTIPHFNWSITTGLQSWGRHWPVVREYIASRATMLKHWVPKSWDALPKRLREQLDEQFDYSFHGHVNHYDYRGVAEAFYVMYNPYALSLMMDDAAFAPQYFAELYDRPPLKKLPYGVQPSLHRSRITGMEKFTCPTPSSTA